MKNYINWVGRKKAGFKMVTGKEVRLIGALAILSSILIPTDNPQNIPLPLITDVSNNSGDSGPEDIANPILTEALALDSEEAELIKSGAQEFLTDSFRKIELTEAYRELDRSTQRSVYVKGKIGSNGMEVEGISYYYGRSVPFTTDLAFHISQLQGFDSIMDSLLRSLRSGKATYETYSRTISKIFAMPPAVCWDSEHAKNGLVQAVGFLADGRLMQFNMDSLTPYVNISVYSSKFASIEAFRQRPSSLPCEEREEVKQHRGVIPQT